MPTCPGCGWLFTAGSHKARTRKETGSRAMNRRATDRHRGHPQDMVLGSSRRVLPASTGPGSSPKVHIKCHMQRSRHRSKRTMTCREGTVHIEMGKSLPRRRETSRTREMMRRCDFLAVGVSSGP